MKSDDLRKAIGEIDDDLIEASEKTGKAEHIKISWARWGAAAAALVCIITAAAIVPGMLKESVSVTVPDIKQLDNIDVTARDNAGGEDEKSVTDKRQTGGETENGPGSDIETDDIQETEPAATGKGNPDVTEAVPGEEQSGREKTPGGEPGDNPGAVYSRLPVGYEEARERFGHPIVRCEDAGFTGYSVGIVSRSGNTGAEGSVCVDAEYGFSGGTITVRDENRFAGEFSVYNPVEYEYLGRTFMEDGDSAYGENRMLVYYPYGKEGDMIYIAMFDRSYDIYGIMDLLISLEF